MSQNIDVLLSQIQIPPSHEELEIFNSYKGQINNNFELFKKINLALSEQEEELRNAKDILYKKVKEFEDKKDNANDILNIINKEIDSARNELNELKNTCNQYKRQIRYLEKKLISLKMCLPLTEKN